MLNLRSLRVRLSIWYVIFTLGWMSCIGLFSWLYLRSALASSRQHTMEKREHRLITYMRGEWRNHPDLSLSEQFAHYLEGGIESGPIQIFELDGRRLYPSTGEVIAWPSGDCRQPCFGVVKLNGHRLRVMSHVVDLDGRPLRLCMAGVVDEHYDIVDHVLDCYLLAFPVMLIASIAGGFLLSRRALEPVDRITRDAHTIGIHDLSRRLPVTNTGDELQRLTETWNELLARLESAVNRLTQFTSDISHDLRTSTAVMLASAQLALRRERTGVEYRRALSTIALECEATSALLNDLLTIARAEVSQPALEMSPVNLADIVSEVGEQMRAQATVKALCFDCSTGLDAWVLGNGTMLRRLVSILVDNAIKYTPDGGSVRATVEQFDGSVRLYVHDTGIGIGVEDASRVFERFFRADRARSRENGGNGLGLSIARWIADNHAASIQLSSKIGEGSVFTFEIPRLVGFDQSSADLVLPDGVALQDTVCENCAKWLRH